MNDLGKKKNVQNKNITRRTQTYERDIAIGYDPFDREGDLLITDEDRAIEYDPDFAKDLLKNLIDNLSDLPSSTDEKKSEFDLDSQGFIRRKRRVTRENFDLDDILGTFNIDDFGNIVLDTQALRDNLGRRVNKHGYLVDAKGNILNQEGDILFHYAELDEDEDLPHPYRFEKRRKHLLKEKSLKFGMTTEGAEARRLFDIDSVMMNEDEQVEEEFQKLRDLSRPSSVDSLMGNNNMRMINNNSAEKDLNLDLEDHESKSAADKRAIQMAKAYGGQPPVKKDKKKKTTEKKAVPKTLDDFRPPTDRLFPSLLLQQEEERVKKIAKVAYRQQQDVDGVEGADSVGFQEFFKSQMKELEQNRIIQQETHQRNHA